MPQKTSRRASVCNMGTAGPAGFTSDLTDTKENRKHNSPGEQETAGVVTGSEGVFPGGVQRLLGVFTLFKVSFKGAGICF